MLTHQQLIEEASTAGITRVVVGAAIEHDSRVLVLRRKADDFMGGMWELPSGVKLPEETLEVALRREVLEECGFSVGEIGGYLGSFDYESKSGRKTRQFTFAAAAPPSPVVVLSEHDASRWLSEAELGEVELSPATTRIVRQFFAHRAQ